MKASHQNPNITNSTPAHPLSDKKAFKKAQRRASESAGVGTSGKSHGPVPVLELFQKENCPFCHAVRSKLTRLGIDYVSHNVPDDQPLKQEKLIQAGGKYQVPFLIDHSSGVKLYESRAIIAYLDKSYGSVEAKDWMGRLTRLIDFQLRDRAEPLAWRVASPLLKAQRFQLSAMDAFETLSGTFNFVRERIRTAMDEAKSKMQGAEGTGAAGEPGDPELSAPGLKTEKSGHADVVSATESEAGVA